MGPQNLGPRAIARFAPPLSRPWLTGVFVHWALSLFSLLIYNLVKYEYSRNIYISLYYIYLKVYIYNVYTYVYIFADDNIRYRNYL